MENKQKMQEEQMIEETMLTTFLVAPQEFATLGQALLPKLVGPNADGKVSGCRIAGPVNILLCSLRRK